MHTYGNTSRFYTLHARRFTLARAARTQRRRPVLFLLCVYYPDLPVLFAALEGFHRCQSVYSRVVYSLLLLPLLLAGDER